MRRETARMGFVSHVGGCYTNVSQWAGRRGGMWGGVGIGVLCVFMVQRAMAQAPYSAGPMTEVAEQSRVEQPGKADTSTVTLVLRDSTMDYVLRALAQKTRRQIIYDNSISTFRKRVDVRVINANIRDALATILKGTDLVSSFAPDGETIVIRPGMQESSVANRIRPITGSITGSVTDSATGKAIAGATVTVIGTKSRAVTNESGQFVLNAVAVGEHVVVVKGIGYKTSSRSMTVVEGKSINVRILLVPAATLLSGVVTTATGEQLRREIGNDVVSINVDSVMQVAPISTVTDLLENRVPGLTVLRSGGTPGAPSRIRIRGATSLTQSNDPIVVVDGVRIYADMSDSVGQQMTNTIPSKYTSKFSSPSPLDQVDPNSIERIDVFKGPSAAAMYGSDAANGVIVITTKRGREGPMRWNIVASQGLTYMPGEYPENIQAFGKKWNGGILTSRYDQMGFAWNSQIDSIVRFQAMNNPRMTVLGRGDKTQVSSTVSGGVSRLDYSVTGTVGRELGILKLPTIEYERYRKFNGVNPPDWMHRPDQYNTWGLTSSLGIPLGQDAQITLRNNVFNSRQQQSSLNQAIDALRGAYIDEVNLDARPIIQQFNDRAVAEQLHVLTSVGFSWQIASWLPVTGSMGLDVMNGTRELLHQGDVIARDLQVILDTSSSFQAGRNSRVGKSLSLQSTSIPVGDRMFLTVGVTGNSQSMRDMLSRADFLPPGVERPTILTSGTQSSSARNTFGWFAEPRFNFKSRFFIMPGFRLDQNGLAGKNANLMAFPKLNFSWVASEEDYFPFKHIISLLRPRLAFGVAGTQPGATQRLRLLTQEQLTVAGTKVVDNVGIGGLGVFLSNIGNQSIRPERSVEIEGGFDAELWQNRISVTLTLAKKVRHDAIVSVELAPSVMVGSASTSISDNIGVVQETTTEATFGAQIMESRSFGWHVSGSLSRGGNVLKKLNRDFFIPDFISGLGVETRFVEGYPLSGRWAKPVVGYADANGNGLIDGNEVLIGDSSVYLGQQEIGLNMTFGTTMSLFQGVVSINAYFDYQNGMTQRQNFQSGQSWLAGEYNALFAQQAAILALTSGSNHSAMVQEVKTVRFQSLGVTSRIPKQFSRLIGIPVMTMSIKGNNLGLWTNYRGKDPNVNGSVYGNEVSDLGGIPQPRLWTLSFTLAN